MTKYSKKPRPEDFGLKESEVNLIESMLKENKKANEINETVKKKINRIWTCSVIGYVIFFIIFWCNSEQNKSLAAFFVITLIWFGFTIGLHFRCSYKETAHVHHINPVGYEKFVNYIKALEQYKKDEELANKIAQQHLIYKTEITTKSVDTKLQAKTSSPIKQKSTTKTLEDKIAEKNPLSQPQTPIEKNVGKTFIPGMVIKHPTFGEGTIKTTKEDGKELRIYFTDSASYKLILSSLVELDIIYTPPQKSALSDLTKINKSTTKPVAKEPEKTKKEPEPIVKVYEKANIKLTQIQNDIFDEMINISKKYCLDLGIDERDSLVGVGLVNQEKLRFYILKRNSKVYVRFANSPRYIPLSKRSMPELYSLTKDINEEFEKDPDRYLLPRYQSRKVAEEKAALAKQQEEQKQLETVSAIPATKDIFTVDADTYDDTTKEAVISTEEEQVTSDIDYDKDIFRIVNTTLEKFISTKQEKSSYVIPQGVETIGESAFAENSILYDLTIPNSVTSIKDKAFYNSRKLRMLTLPSSIKEIGKNVFDGCCNLETLFVETKAVRKLLVDLPKSIEIVCLEF